MNNKLVPILLILNMISVHGVMAAQNFTYTSAQPEPVYNNVQQSMYAQNNTLQGSVVMVPAGATMNAMLTTAISTETIKTGQVVTMALNKDFYYDDKLIAPAGSTIVGTAIEASPAKRGSINGRLCVRFTQINTPNGTQIPISAVIQTEDGTGVLVGGTKLDTTIEYAKDAVVGVAAGAVTGVVFGALAGGSVGRAAALGTAVGGGGGLIKSAFDKGHEVTIPTNASINLVFTQPISAGVSNYHYEN